MDCMLSRESRAQGRWWDFSGLDRRSQDKPRYTNAPMTALGARGEGSGGYWRPFCLNFGVFVVNACQALLADQLESSGMATVFGKLSEIVNVSAFSVEFKVGTPTGDSIVCM